MDGEQILNILFRWIHVGTAIALLGGTLFMRFVLMPSAEKLSTEEHDKLREALLARWKRFVHIGILLLLVSGFYNYIRVAIPAHSAADDKVYHRIIGPKILLAFIVFFIASVLVGRSQAFEKMRQDRKKWLTIILILGFVIVAISSYLKIRPY